MRSTLLRGVRALGKRMSAGDVEVQAKKLGVEVLAGLWVVKGWVGSRRGLEVVEEEHACSSSVVDFPHSGSRVQEKESPPRQSDVEAKKFVEEVSAR
jgi:formylmethanofuran dehydrogenase subunit C